MLRQVFFWLFFRGLFPVWFDGKRSEAMDVVVALLLAEKLLKGREFDGGRVKYSTGSEAGG